MAPFCGYCVSEVFEKGSHHFVPGLWPSVPPLLFGFLEIISLKEILNVLLTSKLVLLNVIKGFIFVRAWFSKPHFHQMMEGKDVLALANFKELLKHKQK